MRFMKSAVAALGLTIVAVTASTSLTAQASIANPVSGTDFRTLDHAQPVEPSGKVEVIEFFMYTCPHCNAFDPALSDWVKAQGANIVFKRVPLAFHPEQEVHQKLYYALEALGKNEELHKRIFHAIHVEHHMLRDEAEIADFAAAQGIDRAKFVSAFESFSVQTKVRQAQQLAQAYQVDGVPLLAIDGRYETSPSVVQDSVGDKPEQELFGAALKVADWLVARAAKEHKPAAAASVAPAAAPAAAKKAASTTKK
ncbi:MAG: thiol:disulfide interchange protein DsbA/DsbL [Burkholderiaceae bacterium]|nr:thiol:disulfide interchange protein DsbA/DsbL [Burkholderiaceae bacterium]